MKIFSCAVLAILLAALAGPGNARAQSLNIGSITVATNGLRQISFTGEPTNYYVLYRGDELSAVSTPVRVAFGAPTMLMEDRTELLDASFYRVAAIPTNAPLDLDGDGADDVTELNAGTDPLIAHSLVINEVDYDQVGTDTAEFVEIFNSTANSVDLGQLALVLINGANNQQYLRINLSGSLAAGQYLVVGSTNVIATLPSGVIGIGLPDATIQNGSPDGILLFNRTNNGILDAFSYEGSITAAVLAGVPTTFNLVEGTALSATVADSNSVNGSLIRYPNGHDSNNANADWVFTSTPTPGTANVP